MKILVLSLIGTLVVGSACNSYTPKDQGDNGQLTAGNTAPDFAMIQTEILQPYCVSCHGAAGGDADGINLETYAKVTTYISQIQSAVTVNQTMPPGQPLSSQLQQLLVTWISSGAPENTVPEAREETPPTEPSAPVPVEDLQPTFSSISKNIFTPKCIACHGSDPDSVFMNYDALMKSTWVVPNDIEKSALYNSVKTQAMPPGAPLTQKEIDDIGAWITDGANNN